MDDTMQTVFFVYVVSTHSLTILLAYSRHSTENAPQVEQCHTRPVISVIRVEHIVLHSIFRNQLQAFARCKITRCNVSSGGIAKTHLTQTRLVAAVSGIEIANRTRSFPDCQSTFE